jgi:hypothetical protein
VIADEADRTDAAVFAGAARRARLQGDRAAAAERLERAAEAADNPTEALLCRARAYLLRDRPAEAREMLIGAMSDERGDMGASDLRVLNLLGEANRHIEQEGRRVETCEVFSCGTVGAYRKLARTLPREGDAIVEIGCADGLTTRLLARRARLVVAVDSAPQVVEVARTRIADTGNVRFIVADADEVGRVAALTGVADLLFVDVGGSSPPWTSYKHAKQYRDLFLPRAVILRNKELNDFVRAVKTADQEGKPDAWTDTLIPLWQR